MTPEMRARVSAQKWLRTLLQETNEAAAMLEQYLAPEVNPPAQITSILAKLRKAVKRAGYHGLGENVQPMLTFQPKQ